ncbi:hypothetical protein FSARC_2986 [Fusarium sarcochroum]|uniref:Uncharacterized protein n=1 Tax=Fusarium sarcochroum TaxID=1208366 RepID=A0A8H4XC90_9HYPO|nr:hypothetical protein FSARC_2986 [Fusarium sarcochroum]
MKATFFSLGLFASLASIAVAIPQGETKAMKEARAVLYNRNPQIVCAGCVNHGDCTKKSDPTDCNKDSDDIAADCNTFCFESPALGCVCCDIVDGETDNDSCSP